MGIDNFDFMKFENQTMASVIVLSFLKLNKNLQQGRNDLQLTAGRVCRREREREKSAIDWFHFLLGFEM